MLCFVPCDLGVCCFDFYYFEIILVKTLLFFIIRCVDFCIRVLLLYFPVYFLVILYYFNVRKPTFLYYHPNFVSESLACCLKSTAFFSDFKHYFRIASLLKLASKIKVECKLVSLCICCVLYLVSVVSEAVVCWPEKNIVIITIIYSLEFFKSALPDGISLEFERQQVSSSLQDYSQYFGRLQYCCRLDGLDSSANFQILKAF